MAIVEMSSSSLQISASLGGEKVDIFSSAWCQLLSPLSLCKVRDKIFYKILA